VRPKPTHHRLHLLSCNALTFLYGLFNGFFNPSLQLADVIHVDILGVDVHFLDLLVAGYFDFYGTFARFDSDHFVLQLFLQLFNF